MSAFLLGMLGGMIGSALYVRFHQWRMRRQFPLKVVGTDGEVIAWKRTGS